MSTRYYGIALGGAEEVDVTEASSTTSKAIELAVVYTTTNLDKRLVLQALDVIKRYILRDTWPPV